MVTSELGAALRGTFELNRDVVPRIARKLVEKGFTGMAGHGLGTSQFVAQTASGAFWDFARWNARDLDSLEYVKYGHPIDFSKTVFFSYSGSGSTVDSNRAAARAKELGAYQVAFTSIAGSPITQKCDETIVCGRLRHRWVRHLPLYDAARRLDLAGAEIGADLAQARAIGMTCRRGCSPPPTR